MSEAVEAYEVTLRQNGLVKTIKSTLQPFAVFSSVELAAISVDVPGEIEISVVQISKVVGPGPTTSIKHLLN